MGSYLRRATLVSFLADQYYDSLFLRFPIIAPRYDIDRCRFGPFPFPPDCLGKNNYGLADMQFRIPPMEFNYCDIKTAKKIRNISDNGNLWIQIKLRNSRIQIKKGARKVERPKCEKILDRTCRAILVLGYALCGGKSERVVQNFSQIERTKEVPRVLIRISGHPEEYCLYNANTMKKCGNLQNN